jgi:hypothetical protein
VSGCGDHPSAGAGENQKKGAEHLSEQAPPFTRGILKPFHPPGIAREVPAGRPLAICFANA